jgi:DNA topoisomerase-3
VVTYPESTPLLPNDIYPKVWDSEKLDYAALTQPLWEKKIKKSPKVFNDKKSNRPCDYSNGDSSNLQYNQQVCILQQRFIAVFYDDCLVAILPVVGKLPIFYSKPLEKKS